MSISNASKDEKPKYDEENLNQSDGSEEVRQLQDRIVELEGMTRMTNSSSIASFEILAPNGNGNKEMNVEQMEGTADQSEKHLRERFVKMEMELKQLNHLCVVTQLENKALQSELAHHKLLVMTEHNELKAKVEKMEQTQQKMVDQLEKQQNEQQTEFDQFEQKHTSETMELKTDQQKMLDKIDQLARQVKESKLFKQEFPSKFSEMENFVGVLKDRFGNELLKAVRPDYRRRISEVFSNPSQNCWNVNAAHGDLEIFGPECLMVHYKADGNKSDWPWRVVFAKCSRPPFTRLGIFYYEVKILNMKRNIKIGFASKKLAMDTGVGEHADSYAYVNNGSYWINGKINDGKTAFARDDVVGCGINLATGRIIFTKNGQRLDTADFFISSRTDEMFPCVSLLDSGDLINANFGPDFKFNPSAV